MAFNATSNEFKEIGQHENTTITNVEGNLQLGPNHQ